MTPTNEERPEFRDLVLCSKCSNYNPGVIVHGWSICVPCVQDDEDLLLQAFRLAAPEVAERFGQAMSDAGFDLPTVNGSKTNEREPVKG